MCPAVLAVLAVVGVSLVQEVLGDLEPAALVRSRSDGD
jgi:hypothetical protein